MQQIPIPHLPRTRIAREARRRSDREGCISISISISQRRLSRCQPRIAFRPNRARPLLRVVRAERIDLLVAGAYGHSRLGEWVFGGVTRDFLRKGTVCCLCSRIN